MNEVMREVQVGFSLEVTLELKQEESGFQGSRREGPSRHRQPQEQRPGGVKVYGLGVAS